MPPLTLADLTRTALAFVTELSHLPIPSLFRTTDGKAIGTFVEHEFHRYLGAQYSYILGSSASGIDFPELNVDLKVTSIRQPQSSCPFRDASQKVYGLGYHLLVMVYEKFDDLDAQSARLNFRHVIFVQRDKTGDYQTTYGLNEIIRRNGNEDDIVAFLEERNLPLDEIGRERLAKQILQSPPPVGYLTVSNALQWRLQYSRVIDLAGQGATPGVERIL